LTGRFKTTANKKATKVAFLLSGASTDLLHSNLTGKLAYTRAGTYHDDLRVKPCANAQKASPSPAIYS